MERLELLRCLVGYLPYDLWVLEGGKDYRCLGLEMDSPKRVSLDVYLNWNAVMEEAYFRAILRPLRLREEIEHKGKRFVPLDELNKLFHDFSLVKFEVEQDLDIVCNTDFGTTGYINFNEYHGIIQKLFEWHFDFFGLIKKGWAVSMDKYDMPF